MTCWIQDPHFFSQLVPYVSHRILKVRIVGDHNRRIIVSFIGIRQKMRSEVDIRTLFLRLDHTHEWTLTDGGPSELHLDGMTREVTQNNLAVWQSIQRSPVDRLPRSCSTPTHARSKEFDGLDFIVIREQSQEHLLEIQPLVGRALYGSVVEIEPIYVADRLQSKAPTQKAEAPSRRRRPRGPDFEEPGLVQTNYTRKSS